MQILGDQQFYKFIKKSADTVFQVCVLFPEALHGGAGRPGIIAQYHPSGSQKIAERDGNAVPRVPGGYNRPAQAVVPGFRFAYTGIPRRGRVAKDTLQAGDGDAPLQFLRRQQNKDIPVHFLLQRSQSRADIVPIHKIASRIMILPLYRVHLKKYTKI